MFSRINKLSGASANTVMFTKEVEAFRESIYGNSNIRLKLEANEKHTEIMYNIPVDGMSMDINPTPLTRRDFDLGGCDLESDSEFEDDWEECQGTYNPSVHKATIPIARLRELTDEDDVGDLVTYRCSNCSKCQDCKNSNRSKAISM